MAISSSEHATLGKHVHDRRDENPPVVLLVAVVKYAVLQPRLLVLVQSGHVPVSPLQLPCCRPDLEDEESKDAGE